VFGDADPAATASHTNPPGSLDRPLTPGAIHEPPIYELQNVAGHIYLVLQALRRVSVVRGHITYRARDILPRRGDGKDQVIQAARLRLLSHDSPHYCIFPYPISLGTVALR